MATLKGKKKKLRVWWDNRKLKA